MAVFPARASRETGVSNGAPRRPPPTAQDMFGREIRCFRHGEHCLDCMAQGAEDLSPLVILQSLEYPGWPTQEFCSQAELAGFRTISVRRPGFGRVPPVPDVDQQVALIGAFLEALGRPDIVLVSSGTANPLSYRLARHPQVGLTVLGNCCFNHDPMGEIRPDWFARNMEQTLTSLTGARLALMGLKGAHGIFGKFWVTENFMQKSPGDSSTTCSATGTCSPKPWTACWKGWTSTPSSRSCAAH